MAVDERYLRIRRSLEEKLGVEEASYLMDRPPGGWSELVTKQLLDATRHEILAEMHREFAAIHRELRDQTWRFSTVVIAAMGVMGALFGGLVAFVGS